MKQLIGFIAVAVLCFSTVSLAQMGSPVGVPSITATLGVGGGLSSPTGDLSTGLSSGYHGTAKLTLGAILPFDIDAAVAYHHLAFSAGSDSWRDLQIAAGFQYAFPMPVVSPYILVDAAYNSESITTAGSNSVSREGINLGVGAKLFSFDATLQYEMLNLAGKDTGETNDYLIALSVMYSFGL